MDIREFAEVYNKKMDWNKDILEALDRNILNGSVHIKGIIDEYLETKNITLENCDLSDFEMYEGTNSEGVEYYELHIYNYDEESFIYYWIFCLEETEEEYKRKKIEVITNEVRKRLHKLDEMITQMTKERSDLEEFEKLL